MIRALIALVLLALPASADSLRLIVPGGMRPVVGEMIPVTVRGEYTGRITLEKMTFPDSDAYDWIQVARDKWADERVDGKPFRTFERRIAVFPRQTGTLKIGPVTHNLTKFGENTRIAEEIVADPITLPVMAYPGHGRPLVAREVEVKDEYSTDPSKLRPDESFTRRITVTAEGTMGQFLPSRPTLREPWLISFAAPERRDTHLTAEGPVAVVTWEWTLRPKTGEVGALEPIQVFFYNPLIRELRGAFTLPIEVGAAGTAGNIAGAATPPQSLRIYSLAALVAGVLIALIAGFIGTTGRGLSAMRDGARRLLPNPHRSALDAAAGAGDLDRLRQATVLYLRHEAQAGRSVDPHAMTPLDEAMFAADPAPFDARAFATWLTSRRRRKRPPAVRDA